VSWTEDVLLPDGRTVTLTRYEEYEGPHELGQPPTSSDHWFEFTQPDTKERVRWEHDRTLGTVALSINDGIPELLTRPTYNGTFEYKCPDPAYLAFHFVNGSWIQIPLTQMRRKIVPPNMNPGYDVRGLDGIDRNHLNADDVQQTLPYEWRGNKVIDLTMVSEQTFGKHCDPPFNYMIRDSDPA